MALRARQAYARPAPELEDETGPIARSLSTEQAAADARAEAEAASQEVVLPVQQEP